MCISNDFPSLTSNPAGNTHAEVVYIPWAVSENRSLFDKPPGEAFFDSFWTLLDFIGLVGQLRGFATFGCIACIVWIYSLLFMRSVDRWFKWPGPFGWLGSNRFTQETVKRKIGTWRVVDIITTWDAIRIKLHGYYCHSLIMLREHRISSFTVDWND